MSSGCSQYLLSAHAGLAGLWVVTGTRETHHGTVLESCPRWGLRVGSTIAASPGSLEQELGWLAGFSLC